jgi:YVTN family beta-propeller protein
VDVATREVVTTLDVGDTPVGAWPGADGLMYVDNEAGESLSVIDPAAREVVATIDLMFEPALAAIAPDGSLWVTDPAAGRIAVLDATTGVATGEIVVGAGAHAIVFDRAGTKAYVSNQDEATVSVVDVGAGSVVATIQVGTKPNGMAVLVP